MKRWLISGVQIARKRSTLTNVTKYMEAKNDKYIAADIAAHPNAVAQGTPRWKSGDQVYL